MVPVIMKTSKEAFTSKDVLFDFLRGRKGGVGGGGVKILYHTLGAQQYIINDPFK